MIYKVEGALQEANWLIGTSSWVRVLLFDAQLLALSSPCRMKQQSSFRLRQLGKIDKIHQDPIRRTNKLKRLFYIFLLVSFTPELAPAVC